MSNWKAQLHDLLLGLTRTHGHEPLAEVQRILRGVLDVEDIRFQDRDGRELHSELSLQQAVDQSATVSVRLTCAKGTAPTATEAVPAGESRFREGTAAAPAGNIAADDRYDRFLREFLRLEERHAFMWAGYIVRELLPRLGFAPDEAKLVLDYLRAEELVTITKVPNPKNPEFPATGVQLNHEHPRVKALLADEPPPEPAETATAQASDDQPVSTEDA